MTGSRDEITISVHRKVARELFGDSGLGKLARHPLVVYGIDHEYHDPGSLHHPTPLDFRVVDMDKE